MNGHRYQCACMYVCACVCVYATVRMYSANVCMSSAGVCMSYTGVCIVAQRTALLLAIIRCRPHSPVYTMDPASMRALSCAANRPLGQVFDVIVGTYLEKHRNATLLDTTLEPPVNRCIMKVGRGRCRKPVTRVAVVQFCWKHQPGGGLCFPEDSGVCHWNFHGLLQSTSHATAGANDAAIA